MDGHTGGTQIPHLITAWTARMTAEGRSTSTIAQRIETMQRFATRVRVDPVTATTDDVVTFLSLPHAITGAPLSAASRDTYYRDLLAWFTYLTAAGIRADSPMTGLTRPPKPKGVPRPITTGQYQELVADARGDLLAWLLLGGLEGYRVSDMARMCGEHIQGDSIYVEGGKGDKDAVLPLHPRVAALAQFYPRHGWWFPARRAGSRYPHVWPESITGTVATHFRAHGITRGGPHRLRHYFATELIRAGTPISVVRVLMRHENLATTQIYLQVTHEEATRAVIALPDPYRAAA